LEEQGIVGVLAAAAAKLSVPGHVLPPGPRANKVECASTKPCQGAAQSAGCLQGASDAVDFKVEVSSSCAGASDGTPAHDTAIPVG
jgi:hypothetical protein